MLPGDGQTLHSASKKLKLHLFSITSVNCATSYWNDIFLTAFHSFFYRFFHLTIFRFLSRTVVSGETLTSTSELYTELHTVDDSVEVKEAVFSDCFLGGQNISKKWTDPSVAVELMQFSLQSSKDTDKSVPLDKSKQANIFPVPPQKPFCSLDAMSFFLLSWVTLTEVASAGGNCIVWYPFHTVRRQCQYWFQVAELNFWCGNPVNVLSSH